MDFLQGMSAMDTQRRLVSAINKKIKQLKALNEKYLSLLEENAALKAELEKLKSKKTSSTRRKATTKKAESDDADT